MRVRAIALLVGLLALVLPLTAAHASAASSTFFRFAFKAHGYVVAASGERATVVISVTRKERSRHRGAETDYVARGTSSGGLRAVLPGIGRIAMHFEPTGHWHASAHCAPGRPRIERAGVFVGKLRFVGEHRYLTTVRRRARGSERQSGRACPSTGDRRDHRSLRLGRRPGLGPPSTELSPAERGPRTLLLAGFRSGPLARAFEASKQARGRLVMAATEEDVVDELGTYRTVFARAPRSRLRATRTLSSASVRGIGPFAGTATLRRAKNGSRSWTGDLTASFLGDPDVAMTGPLFKSRLSRGF
jgi:hypothetical protein